MIKIKSQWATNIVWAVKNHNFYLEHVTKKSIIAAIFNFSVAAKDLEVSRSQEHKGPSQLTQISPISRYLQPQSVYFLFSTYGC